MSPTAVSSPTLTPSFIKSNPFKPRGTLNFSSLSCKPGAGLEVAVVEIRDSQEVESRVSG